MAYLKTAGYLSVLSLILLVLGYFIAGYPGIFFALFIAIVMCIMALLYSDKNILQQHFSVSLYPEAINSEDSIVKQLANKAGIPVPAVYLINSDAVNIFAVGSSKKSATIGITQGLLEQDESSKRSAIAFAIAQITTGDILLRSVSAYIAHAIYVLFNINSWKNALGLSKTKQENNTSIRMGATIASPIAGFFVRMILSPRQIFQLDQQAVNLTNDLPAYKKTLEGMDTLHAKHVFSYADASPSTCNVFMVNPLKDAKMTRYFSRFPTIADRLIALS